MANKSQQQQPVNLFDSDDDYNADDDDPKDNLVALKPYEENLNKLNKWYNEFFTKTSLFEDRRRIHHGIPDYLTVQISYMASERKTGIFDIISSKHKNINKIAITFIYLDLEIQKIKETFSQKLNNIIMLYGERPEQDLQEVILKEGQAETEISRIFQTFRQMYDLVKCLMAIIYNIINQLNSIYNKKDLKFYGVFKNIDLFFALDSIGHALQIIYTLDCIVNDNENLLNHWNQYKKMINIVKKEPEKYGSTAQSIKQLDRMLARQEKTVMSGKCTQGVLQPDLDANAQLTSSALKNGTQQIMGKNKELMEFFRNYFKHKLQILTNIVGTAQETNERDQIMPMLGVYAIFRRIYPSEEERKTYKQMWSLQKKVPVIEAHAHVLIYIFKVLTDVCPLQKKSNDLDPQNPVENVMLYIKQLDSTLEQQINSNYSIFCTWISRMDSIITSNPQFFGEGSKYLSKEANTQIINQRMDQRIKLILNGILITQQIRNVIYNSVTLHLSQQIPIPPSISKSIKSGIEILKAVNNMLNQKAEAFNPTFLNKHITKSILPLLAEKISQQRKIDEGQKKKEREEVIGSLTMMHNLLRYPLNNISLLTLNFLLNMLSYKGVFIQAEIENLEYLIWKIQQINRFQFIVQQSTQCQFIYYARELIPQFFKSFIETPSSAKRLPFFAEIFQDCDFLKQQAHLLEKNILFDHFKNTVLTNFNDNYIIPITRSIEDFLRVNIHTMLIAKIEGINPYKQQSTDIKKLLDVNSIELFDQNIDIRSEVVQSLNQNFYNINVLNMHDMETYEQMRSLGNFQFDLQLMNVYIPSQTIDQGQLDILQIIRNIPQFVTKYVYNAYNQMFIEITSESKQLSSITIQQISDSIRTHGLGILNSTVNLVYQFILKRINSFSQFLFDDYIHSPLRREYKYFKENNEALDGKYPYERADHFYKEIKRLGQFEDGKNFLDKFRVMITEIGNALGFVRLLRSASLNYCSKSIEFIPSTIPADLKFAELSKQASMGDTTQQAAEELDDIFSYLRTSFSARTDYLSVLVKAFKQLLTKDNKHLEYFYLIVPSLTQNFVETNLLAKERLNKNNPFQAYFCDDGFIVGLAYFLRLLNQIDQFNSLHWKDEISQYFERNLQELKDNQDKTPVNKRLAEDVIIICLFKKSEMQKGLNTRKLTNQQEEYDLFFYAFNSCIILFRDDSL